jgi:hypothetical protein
VRGLSKNGRGYCVVPMNATSGPLVVARTTREQMRTSIADVVGCYTTRREAEREARRLNGLAARAAAEGG